MVPITLRDMADRLEKYGLQLKLEHAGAWLALVRDDYGVQGRGLHSDLTSACEAAIADYLRRKEAQ